MKEIRWGAIISYLTILCTFIVAIVYTPIMIRLLGKQEYGLYTLMMAFVGYLSILDLGLGNAIVRYIARNREAGTPKEEAKLNGLFLTLFTVIGVITLLIGGLLYACVPAIFGSSLNNEQLEKAGIMVMIMTVNFAFSFPLGVFSSILQAYEKFIIIKSTGLIKVVVQPLIMIVLLLNGADAVAMTYVVCGLNLAMLLVNAVICLKLFKPEFLFGSIDTILLKSIFIFSAFIFINAIVDKIYWQTDQILIGILKGTEDVAIYGVSIQFIMIFISLSIAITSMYLPKISMLVMKENGMEEINKLFIKVGTIQYIILSYVYGGFVLFGKQFIILWVGEEYIQSYYIVIIIMSPFIIDLIQNMGLNVLKAKNLFAFRTKVLITMALLNILISVPSIIYFGNIGAAVTTAIFLLLGNVLIINIYYHKVIGLNVKEFWIKISKIFIVVFISMLITVIITDRIYLKMKWMSLAINISIYIILLSGLLGLAYKFENKVKNRKTREVN